MKITDKLFTRVSKYIPMFFLMVLTAILNVNAVPFDTNLIVNGDAESDIGGNGFSIIAPAGWTTTGNFTVVKYDSSGGFPLSSSPGPIDRGNNFFAGGPSNSFSSALQTIDISSSAADIDTGLVTFLLEGFLGGFASQNDQATVTAATFLSGGGATLGSASIGPVTATDRGNITGLLFQTTSGFIPVATREIQIIIEMTRAAGSYNDGYADNLSLKLSGGSSAVIPEPSTFALLGLGLIALGYGRRKKA